MTDQDRLNGMRALGVKWPKGRAIPTYPAKMTEADKLAADKLYDAMDESFIDLHGAKK